MSVCCHVNEVESDAAVNAKQLNTDTPICLFLVTQLGIWGHTVCFLTRQHITKVPVPVTYNLKGLSLEVVQYLTV